MKFIQLASANGMGQAQSQSSGSDCPDCNGNGAGYVYGIRLKFNIDKKIFIFYLNVIVYRNTRRWKSRFINFI